jgi:hypothetical protein
MHVTVGLDAAAIANDSGLFVGFVGFVVSVQRDRSHLLIWPDCADKHSSRITHVCAEDFGPDDEHRDTSAAAEPKVYLGVVKQSVLDRSKAASQLLFDFG